MRKHFICAAAVVLILALVVPVAAAQARGPRVIDSDAVVFGNTYAQWSAAWWQWAESVPATLHPLLDRQGSDCSAGQAGPVWFLGGKFCANDDPNCGFANIVRTCNVPAGKALYVAVVNAENTTLEDPSKTQIAELRAGNAAAIDTVTNVFLTIDGAAIPNLKERFRVQSPAFSFTLPADNLFKAIYPPERAADFAAGTYFPDVDDGVYVMISPLPAGVHVIHFGGFFPPNFGFDVKYQLVVDQ